jgi:hypothetical protein
LRHAKALWAPELMVDAIRQALPGVNPTSSIFSLQQIGPNGKPVAKACQRKVDFLDILRIIS